MEQKLQVTSDTLYAYLTEHGVTITRLSEITGVSVPTINSCFLHHKMADGTPRRFTAKILEKLNAALVQMSADIRGCLLTFGSEQTFTNQRGKTYDPAMVDAIKKGVGRYFNVNKLCENVLGWNKSKKHNVLETVTGRAYGCISKEDADRINAELLSVAAVLSSYEVVPDGEKSDNNNGTRVEESPSVGPGVNAWDDTALDLWERYARFHRLFPDGLIAFTVNDGFTVCEEDARLLARIDTTLQPYTDPATGHVTLYMDAAKWKQIRRAWDDGDELVAETPMYTPEKM